MSTMRRGQQRAWHAETYLLSTLTDKLDCAINVCRQADTCQLSCFEAEGWPKPCLRSFRHPVCDVIAHSTKDPGSDAGKLTAMQQAGCAVIGTFSCDWRQSLLVGPTCIQEQVQQASVQWLAISTVAGGSLCLLGPPASRNRYAPAQAPPLLPTTCTPGFVLFGVRRSSGDLQRKTPCWQ